MSTISRVSLFGKLNPTLYKSIEGATVFAKLRGNPIVELCHWLYQLLQLDDSDIHRILRDADVEQGRLVAELQRALERLPNGANGIEDLSSDIDTAVERAWMQASRTSVPRQCAVGICCSPHWPTSACAPWC